MKSFFLRLKFDFKVEMLREHSEIQLLNAHVSFPEKSHAFAF